MQTLPKFMAKVIKEKGLNDVKVDPRIDEGQFPAEMLPLTCFAHGVRRGGGGVACT